jgi:hypothetical protein
MSPSRPNDGFVVTEDRLRYFGATESTVTVEADGRHVQVCTISFGGDGSVYVAFPYFPSSSGIVSAVELPSVLSATIKLDLMKGGRVTSHQVKYAHHRSGIAQFSQTGKVRPEVRRYSFPLDGPSGHLFQLQLYHIGQLRAYDSAEARHRRAYLHFRRAEGPTPAVVISAQWLRKIDLLEKAIAVDGAVGPAAPIPDPATNSLPAPYYLVGPPKGTGVGSHLLVLGCATVEMLAGTTGPTMLFLGGWDLHEPHPNGTIPQQHGCLAFMYPVSDPETLREKIGSIDELPVF